MTPIPRPFQLPVSDEVLQDLDTRLGRVRWPIPEGAKITVPTCYVEFPKEAPRPPRSLAERTYTQIQRWTKAARGDHFVALEQPEVLAHEAREFYRPLRRSLRC